ncbi:GDP-mannose mannosyl hydrolase [Halosegnis rubeus]|uniref:GDP-mannose mannosyl hydrolase n=1 Tax=Halosegnis rubeus TaxID=2212850 RepID=UPI001F313988|nr:NUDIX domain-containing protein [Halosegnis rubeus]
MSDPSDDQPIPDAEWRTIIENIPLVSVDLVVRYDGGILLGKRENEPAKGEWFVPGGTVLKNERLTEAVHRVADEELGCTVEIVESLGVFEHFYDTSELSGIDSKHYVANGFVVRPTSEPTVSDDQHDGLRVVSEPYPELHRYVERYLQMIDG